MLVGLGILHLAVTPIIIEVIRQNTAADRVEWFMPPMLLNHVVVGILLLPLGILTFYAASGAVAGERWALVVVRTISVSTMFLPAALLLLMGGRYFGALPFLIAAITISLASLMLIASAFWRGNSSPR